MASTEETYRMAAREHLAKAQDLFENGSYYLAHYLSGLAIECHLRAWLERETGKFERSHDLKLLAEKSHFYRVISAQRLSHFSSVFAIANLRWRSNHRYWPERQFFQYMNDIKAEYQARGGTWKAKIACAMLGCAYEIVNEGETQWNKK